MVALAIDLAGPLVFGVRGFRVSAGHFAERFGLIVIIALGESIVAIGAGIAGVELDAGLVVAAVFGVALSAALWWAYFDMSGGPVEGTSATCAVTSACWWRATRTATCICR